MRNGEMSFLYGVAACGAVSSLEEYNGSIAA